MEEKDKEADDGLPEVSKREEEILEFWRKNNIFEKSLNLPSPNGEFSFYDGPPFATGLPHYGHILAGTMKDLVPRYKTMKGYRVRRTWGWDCHGLPIENLIEKELDLKEKKDIEALGVEKFNEAARESVLRYDKEWKDIVPRLGRWVNMESPYKTMDSSYTESIWWVFNTLYDKGLIYKGYKAMHLCPRCETSLANFEVSQGYKDVTDISLTAKFELVDKPGTFVLAWTTTPWTLPGNVALAVGENIDYVEVKKDKERYILAKNRLSDFGLGDALPMGEFKGSMLVGRSYKPIFDYYSSQGELENVSNGWKIYAADFVSTEEGTGVVHIAPAFGEDDMRLGREASLPFVQHVDMSGRFKPEVLDFAGVFVKPKDDPMSADVLVIKNLAHRGILFDKKKIVHSYPHCWRCDTPLLNYASSSWFLNVPKITDKLLAANEKINWVPDNIKHGRFGKWLEGAREWAISRTRYWGAPLPVWHCDDCDKYESVGSLDELKNKNRSGNRYFIMRHGEGEHNFRQILSGRFDDEIHLTEKGRMQINANLPFLRKAGVDLIFSSDFLRTKETAGIVHDGLGLTRDIIYDFRLREVAAGDLSGKDISLYRDLFKSVHDRFFVKPPNSDESWLDIKNRVADFLFETDSQYKNKNILIVSHGDPLFLLESAASGLTIDETIKKFESGGGFATGEVGEIDFAPFPHNRNFELDLHKPYIDEVSWLCECGGTMKRVNEVFDCWFESGSMPYGELHYPFENKERFEDNFPAEFIAEGIDQTRGWFYSLLVLSTALFDKPAFSNVIVNGIILAEDGQKMSKRLKNYPDPLNIVHKYGADSLRFYLMSTPAVKAEDICLSEKGIEDVYRKIVLRIYNVLSFYETYSSGKASEKVNPLISLNILDRYILSRVYLLRKEVEKGLEGYDLYSATAPFWSFVDDLSTWYIRRSRERFKGSDTNDKLMAEATTRYVVKEFCKILAPWMPFLADYIFKRLRMDDEPESVHLCSWPEEIEEDSSLLDDMSAVREIASLVLERRAAAGIKVRQPLQAVTLKERGLEGKNQLLSLLKDEVNVKEVRFDSNLTTDVLLDLDISERLKEEGWLRDFIRSIQDIRKKEGLQPNDKIVLSLNGAEREERFVREFGDEIKKGVNAGEVVFGELKSGGRGIQVGELTFLLAISVV